MNSYSVKTFSLPPIDGISQKTMETHLGLYAGYIKNLTVHYETLRTLCENGGTPTAISAVNRRIGFELAGVLNHELFFTALEGGPTPLTDGSALHALVVKQFNSVDGFLKAIAHTAQTTRGIGWVLVSYDKGRGMLHLLWVSDHELGSVPLPSVLAVDLWEHAYLMDYAPAEKGSYVDVYLRAINWSTIENLFETL